MDNLADYRSLLDGYIKPGVMSSRLRAHHLNSLKHIYNLRTVRTYNDPHHIAFDIYTPAGVLGIAFYLDTLTYRWTTPTDTLWTP